MEDIEEEVTRSEEEFIKHYYVRYSEPDMPPSWMTLEVVSFGSLSRSAQGVRNNVFITLCLGLLTAGDDF